MASRTSIAPRARRAPLLRFAFAAIGAAALASAVVDEAAVQRRTDALLHQMTLPEKVGQLTQISPFGGAPGKEPETLIRKGLAGSVLWTIDSAQIRRLQEIAVKESRLGIPLLFGFDVVHGYKTVFPIPLALASSWDPAMVRDANEIAALEASVSGINWTFSPMVDIARDARWGRMLEGFGEDPVLGAALARASVLGLQGPRLGTPDHLLACVKHFAGYGFAEGGRDYDSCYVSEGTLRNVVLPPFKAAIDAGAGTAMSAYMCLNDVPATGNRWLLRDVLRTELGFRGFVISDSWSVAALGGHGLARDPGDAAARAAEAGVNMDMGSQTYLDQIPALVESGRLPMPTVDQLVREVLSVKIRLGLFEKPYADTERKEAVFNDPAHREAARRAARKSMVLLKNEHGLLPLKKTVRSIALLGPLADSTEELKGSWTVEGGAAVSVLEGLRGKVPEARIECVHGGDMQRKYALAWDARDGKPAPALMPEAQMEAELTKAVAAARAADVVVMVLGERRNMSGEDASSSLLDLPGNQQRLLEAVVATGKPVVLVLACGRPLDIAWASENVPAILAAWFPGTEGGNAIADLLFGDANPSGKLPVSWPRSVGQCPRYYNHNTTQSNENDPKFTSRYYDASSFSLYPFGYGLSYAHFTYSALRLDRTTIGVDGSIEVSVDVANTGSVAGDEVVQLYLHQRAGSSVRPVRELKGFARVSLAAGEKRTIRFRVGTSQLEYWSPVTRRRAVEPATFDVWVGGDSRASLHAEFTVLP